jgi:two-component system, LytTR family, response regulator
MINCLIVDDEQHAIDILTHYVKQTPFLHLVNATTNPLEAMEWSNTQKIDIIFLDIQMPEISGLDFIRTMQDRAKIILTTAYSEFASEGFDFDVVDYLLKPISMPRFLRGVQRAVNILTRDNKSELSEKTEEDIADDYIFVKTESKGRMLKINLDEIDYIEGMKNYIAIYHNGQKTMALLNMKDLNDRLPKKKFTRVHKSYIVSLKKVTTVEGNRIILKNIKADIIMGDTFKVDFFELMKNKLL